MIHARRPRPFRIVLLVAGILSIVVAGVILVLSLWEAFGGLQDKFKVVELPGFHRLELKSRGLYAGIYRHQGHKPFSPTALSKMDVRLMTEGTYQDVPVMMNTTGQTFNRFGRMGMLLFNFYIEEPGTYTLSGMYLGEDEGPTAPILIVSQSAQSIRQTLMVGAVFFLFFLILGVVILVKLNKWVPKVP